MKTTLKNILKKAIISDNLKKAIKETIKAIEVKNFALACQLTACKSLITGSMEDIPQIFYTFHENQEENEKLLGKSVYSILDGIHHDLAFQTDTMPSGMMAVSSNGITEFKSNGTHPIVKQIQFEKDECAKAAGIR